MGTAVAVESTRSPPLKNIRHRQHRSSHLPSKARVRAFPIGYRTGNGFTVRNGLLVPCHRRLLDVTCKLFRMKPYNSWTIIESWEGVKDSLSYLTPRYPSYPLQRHLWVSNTRSFIIIVYHTIPHISYSTILSLISHTLPYYPSYLILYHTIPHISYSTILFLIILYHTLFLISHTLPYYPS